MIRAAHLGDLPDLVKMAGAMHAESVYRDLPFLPVKVMVEFLGWMNDADGCFFVHVGSDGCVSGFIAGCVAEHFFSNARAAWDRIFYVQPDRRGGIVAHRLYEAFRAWARDRGALDVWPAVSTGSTECANFYRRLNCEETGAVFRDRL